VPSEVTARASYEPHTDGFLPPDEACAFASRASVHSNDLSLLRLFSQTKVILGTMNVSSSRVETVEEMRERLAEALQHIDAERLIVAPDCGLALLDGDKFRPLLNQKLTNMCKAAKCVPCSMPFSPKKRKTTPM